MHAGKFYVDGNGKETEATPDVPVDIGVFAASPRKGVDGKPLYLQKRVLPNGDSTLTWSWTASRPRPAWIRTTS